MFMSRFVTLKYVLKYLLFVYKMGIILFTVYTQGISFLYVQVQFLFFMHPDQAVQAV